MLTYLKVKKDRINQDRKTYTFSKQTRLSSLVNAKERTNRPTIREEELLFRGQEKLKQC